MGKDRMFWWFLLRFRILKFLMFLLFLLVFHMFFRVFTSAAGILLFTPVYGFFRVVLALMFCLNTENTGKYSDHQIKEDLDLIRQDSYSRGTLFTSLEHCLHAKS